MARKPEASYTTKKTSLQGIISSGGDRISDAVFRVDRIAFHALNLLTFFYLEKLQGYLDYRYDWDMPIPNYDMIYLSMRVVMLLATSCA
jgi:hypothetical protein